MSFLRRYILAPIFLWMLALGAACFLVGFVLLETKQNLPLALGVSLGLFVLILILLLYWKLHHPLQKIVQEMRALLTGKSYRRILTTKQNELGILSHFFNEVTRNLESITGDVRTHARIKKELDAAQEIQRDLIPKEAPQIPGLEITAKTRPASEIGGDTFDFFIKNERTLMYIGDSTGHGIPAGIVMVMVDTLIETFIDLEPKLLEMMIKLNKYLKPHLRKTMFMTMILIEWIPSTHQVKWIGAGHEYLIHVRTSLGKAVTIPSGGIAVGMLADLSKLVKEQEIMLAENDFLILYSDGIVEAKNVMGEIYSLKRLTDFIESHVSSEISSEKLFTEIALDVSRFMEGHAQLDDMTLIVMKHTVSKTELKDKTTEWNTV